MSTPRDHHFIPVFYLKRWIDAGGKLFEYSRPYKNKVFRNHIGPKATGFRADLYSFLDCPPEIAQFLESVFLQRTDHLASLALSKLISGNQDPWTQELRSAWSRFTINFLIRHPDPFAEIKAVAQDGWLRQDNVTQLEYERLRRPEDPPTFEEWVLMQGNHLADRIRIRLLQGAMDNEIFGARFNNMLWNVLDLSNATFRLLTSDWPLYKEINGERMLFALPINPTSLFTAVTHAEIFHRLRRARPDQLVRQINASVVSRARLYVYSFDRTQERFIENRMSSAMEPPPFFPTLAQAHAS